MLKRGIIFKVEIAINNPLSIAPQMKSKTKEWLELAKEDLDAAKKSLTVGLILWANIQAQQTVEKALKAVLCEEEKRVPKTHDLVFLGKEVGLNSLLLQQVAPLTRVYLEMRYPDDIKKELKTLEEHQTKDKFTWQQRS